jgi:hypothetical protein
MGHNLPPDGVTGLQQIVYDLIGINDMGAAIPENARNQAFTAGNAAGESENEHEMPR